MHHFMMPDWAVARVVGRQGRASVHDDIPLPKTALVVVDMQDYFMRPGSGAEVPMAREIVPNVNRLAAHVRDAGGVVVWIRTLFTSEALETLAHFHRVLLTPERFELRCAALGEDCDGARLWVELDVREEDLIVGKTRYSAFIQGASGLDTILKARGVEAVWVAGTMTNACCESTARDAMMLNYRTTMVYDANASLRDDEHASALVNFHLFFGDVSSTGELLERR